MKITVRDGREIELPFAAGAAGYVAQKIEITADDIAQMRTMAMDRPMDFYAHMMQLEYRFPERRAPMVLSVCDGEFATKVSETGSAILKIAMSSAYGQLREPFADFTKPLAPDEQAGLK